MQTINEFEALWRLFFFFSSIFFLNSQSDYIQRYKSHPKCKLNFFFFKFKIKFCYRCRRFHWMSSSNFAGDCHSTRKRWISRQIMENRWNTSPKLKLCKKKKNKKKKKDIRARRRQLAELASKAKTSNLFRNKKKRERKEIWRKSSLDYNE